MIRQPDESGFLATFDPPMRFIEAGDDSYNPVPVGDCVAECISSLALPTTRQHIEIHYVYVNDKKQYCRVLLHWGEPNVYLVVVTGIRERNVHGHYLLDLNVEHGLCESEQA